MTVQQARLILLDVKYKGWLFQILTDTTQHLHSQYRDELENTHCTLNIILAVKDSTTGLPIQLTFNTSLTLCYLDTEEKFLEVLFTLIQAAERHESQEQFRYKGVMIYNPHKEEQERYKRVQGIGIHNSPLTVSP